MNTVTLKHFKLNEGTQITEPWIFNASNAFNVAENILLMWCSHIVSKVIPLNSTVAYELQNNPFQLQRNS